MSDEVTDFSEDIWEKALAIFRMSLKTDTEKNQWERHFPSFLSHKRQGNEIVIGVIEPMMVEWFTPKYAKPLQLALQLALQTAGQNSDIIVVFRVDEKATLPASLQTPTTPEPAVSANTAQSRTATRPVLQSTLPLTESYTFDNFVKGPSNSFAYDAATAVSRGPGRTSYNPLFIYGGTGLGKTHLMQAIGHYVKANQPNLSICYITCEMFMNEYVNHILNKSVPVFRDRYRKYDILLLDDIQFGAGKANFQEEFFNTFNHLLSFKKQIVITSDVAPRDLQGLEERLTSRFSAGMVVEIESPKFETRLAILKFKAQASRHIIPDEVLQFIAENIRSHVRAIEGALKTVVTFMDFNPGMTLTLDIVKRLLKDSIEEEQQIKNLTPSEIIQTVATMSGLTVADIKSVERTAALITPRQTAMFLCCKLTTCSLPVIGKAFNKTHATVFHGSQAIQKRLDVEPELRKTVEQIVCQLGRKPSDVFE